MSGDVAEPGSNPKKRRKKNGNINSVSSSKVPAKDLIVVGIGASIGSLQALEIFFTNLHADSDMSFVIVQDIDPHHAKLLNSILSKETSLRINHIKNGTHVKANQIYIKPPRKDVVIKNRILYLHESKKNGISCLPIDTFFRSLAEDQKEKAVCIILSGAGNDGILGAKLIKGEGGMVIAQDVKEAQYSLMPKRIIDAGLADIILPVEKMPLHIMRLGDNQNIIHDPETPDELVKRIILDILMIVKNYTGYDFSQYKQGTIIRRIQRRMTLNQLGRIEDYRRYLRQNRDEVTDLFDDLTVNVTSFFRDREAFLALMEKGIRPLVKNKEPGSCFRVWVPGCASGEEAYSLAILLNEAAEEQNKSYDFKIFGTDINAGAIESARSGEFPENILADVTEERLKRFFIKRGNKYYVDNKIRGSMIFTVHDVTRDPPFSRMDLISCRNLLIYMDTRLQSQVLPILHSSLNPGGILFLGTSETVGDASRFFAPINKKNNIYQRRDVKIKPVSINKKQSEIKEGELSYGITGLDGKLQMTGQDFQATIEELESAKEELKANIEEFQSTSEELISCREELQSIEEELEALNTELSRKKEELLDAEYETRNLCNSSEMGVIFLDGDLNIKRVTRAANEWFGLNQERDIGRPIKDIAGNFKYDMLYRDVNDALDTLTRKELKIMADNGSLYAMRIVPYRSRKNVIKGVIVTFLDITRYEESELNARYAKRLFYDTLSAIWDPILILNEDFTVYAANRAFYETFKLSPQETEFKSIFELDKKHWNNPELKKSLEEIIPNGNEFEGFEMEYNFPGQGTKKISINARKIIKGEERPAMIFLSLRVITESL